MKHLLPKIICIFLLQTLLCASKQEPFVARISGIQSFCAPVSWIAAAAYAIKTCFFCSPKPSAPHNSWREREWQQYLQEQYKHASPASVHNQLLGTYQHYLSPAFCHTAVDFPQAYDYVCSMRQEKVIRDFSRPVMCIGNRERPYFETPSPLCQFLDTLSPDKEMEFWQSVDALERALIYKHPEYVNPPIAHRATTSSTAGAPTHVDMRATPQTLASQNSSGLQMTHGAHKNVTSDGVHTPDFIQMYNKRTEALQTYAQHKEALCSKSYEISESALSVLRKYELPIHEYQQCKGNLLQQILHEEQIAVVELIAGDQQWSSLHEMAVDFVDLSREYNHIGLVEPAINRLDAARAFACWAVGQVLDVVKNAACNTVFNAYGMCRHPIDTATGMVNGGAYVAYHVAKLMVDYALMVPFLTVGHPYGKKKAESVCFKILAVGNAIESYITEHPYDAAKQGATLVLECYLTNKTLSKLNKFLQHAKASAVDYFKKLKQGAALAIEDRSVAIVVQAFDIVETKALEAAKLECEVAKHAGLPIYAEQAVAQENAVSMIAKTEALKPVLAESAAANSACEGGLRLPMCIEENVIQERMIARAAKIEVIDPILVERTGLQTVGEVAKQAPIPLPQNVINPQLVSAVATAKIVEPVIAQLAAIDAGILSTQDIVQRVTTFNQAAYQEIPQLRQLFDGARKGFGELSTKYIKIPYEHIFGIECHINKKGKISWSGFHHDFMQEIEKSGIAQFTNKIVANNGTYKADVIIDGIREPKTFFPYFWDRQKVITKIYEAYDYFIASGEAALFDRGKYSFVGLTNEGIEVQMYVTLNGHIKSAYPLLKI